jgi:signal transduction histidine kinase
MQFNAKRKDPYRYFIVAFLVLAVIVSAIFLYVRNKKLVGLKEDISKLSLLQSDYSKLDSCIYILYQAENNSRMYAVTADKYYLNQFSTGLKKVSMFVTELDDLGSDTNNEKLKGLIDRKRLKTERFVELRQLMDSLFAGYSKLGIKENQSLAKINLNAIKRQFKTVTKTDTVQKVTAIAAPSKKLFGRIADAIVNKKQKDSAITVVKVDQKKESVDDYTTFNNKLLEKVEDYYRKLYVKNAQLKKEEKEILQLNSKLILNIISILTEYKAAEVNYLSHARASLNTELEKDVKDISGMEKIDIILLACLVMVIFYNIYKLYRNERFLIALNKRAALDSHSKSRFLANMSHEIRTPLNSVVGFSEQLEKGDLTEEQRSQVEAIRNSSEMLLDLVNEILDFSKYEVGKINIEAETFSPEDEIIEVFNSMNVLAESKGLMLEKKIQLDNNISLVGDRLRLKQVIMNLLTNAVKFTSEGKVTLKANGILDSKKQFVLKIQIEDTGVGMAKEDLDIIFHEFSQIYSSAKSQAQGTGLGLAICKKIVELQGGKISVTSVQGKGSVFSFEIPYPLSELPKTVHVSAPAAVESTQLAGKKVLLVDDNKMNVMLIQTILKRWGMLFDSAYDGKQALELYKKKNYDIVLTDIQMPVMGGVELTHEIRYNGDFSKSRIPILGITAHVMQENREAYLKAGMNDLVLKPFLEKDLMDQVMKYV